MVIRALFTKKNYLKYLSHLDLIRLFHRSFNRGDIPIKYSEGFNPHPKFSIAHPLSLGIESNGEFIDIDMAKEISTEDFINRMNHSLPKDIRILKAEYVDDNISITNIISYGEYEIKFTFLESINYKDIKEKIEEYLKRDEIIITRQRKKGRNKVQVEENIKGLIRSLEVKGIDEESFIELNGVFKVGEEGNLRPMTFIETMNRDLNLNIDLDLVYITRTNLFAERDNNLYSPF